MISPENVTYQLVPEPFYELPLTEPTLPDSIYHTRLRKTLVAMKEHGFDYLVFYADREHFNNFDFLTGFGPRFEEGILVLDSKGLLKILLGNECYGMYRQSRIPGEGILCQALSLPNQPMDHYKPLEELFRSFGITASDSVGLVGWKLMYPVWGDRSDSDVPAFITRALNAIAGTVYNATDLFIHPEYGIRHTNGADEIASLEFGATVASDSVQRMLLSVRTGMTEWEVSRNASSGFLPISCFPKVLSGARMDLGMVSPTTNPIRLGDRFQVSIGLRGGLTNRRGFAAYGEEDLEPAARDYLSAIAAPYFATVANWYETIRIGISGGEIYDMVQTSFPREKWGWTLNPGHLISTEEWSASPIFENSGIPLRSGMCLQMDIIPTADRRYAAPNCEDGVVIADEALQSDLRERYPLVYARMQKRRRFMIDELHIELQPEVLPMSNLTGLYRPFMLNRNRAFVIQR